MVFGSKSDDDKPITGQTNRVAANPPIQEPPQQFLSVNPQPALFVEPVFEKPVPLAPEPVVIEPDPEPKTIEALLERISKTKDRVQSRRLLVDLLHNRIDEFDNPRAAQSSLRQALTTINLELIYSRKAFSNDPLTKWYTIKSGDALSRIARKHKTTVHLLTWINGMKSADKIMAGRQIKIIQGPFHAVVTKSAFRMDFFLADPTDGILLYINSVPVGLGEDDSTPLGRFIVRPGAKVVNPEWANPRTGKIWAADDPKNPIGEFWIGLEGADPQTADLAGYGIHGTIDPNSIGKQMSMGCVRLRKADIALTYRLLVEGNSTVIIRE